VDIVEEETKNEIVKKVLEELKNKKLLKNPKSSYKSTEKILYSLNVLPEAVKLIDEEVKKLEEEAKGIAIPTAKSNSLILNERNNTYVYGDETLETRISELKQISVKAKSQVRLVKNALKKIEEDKWYDIIQMYYFDGMKIEAIAEELDCSVSTISDNKKRLMNELKVYIFPDTFIEEL
jgi:RNA polymerase sigma factor (sigma-70 family)